MGTLVAYLAHPKHLRVEARSIAEYVESSLDICLIDPFDHPFTEEWSKNPTDSLAYRIVAKDVRYIKQADIVIALYPESGSIGVPMEIWLAKKLDKPIIVLTSLQQHPWLMYCATAIVHNKADLLSTLKKFHFHGGPYQTGHTDLPA